MIVCSSPEYSVYCGNNIDRQLLSIFHWGQVEFRAWLIVEGVGQPTQSPKSWTDLFYHTIIEPTCAFCMVGSYTSLSVCPYGLDQKSDWIIIHISESIRGRTLKLPWAEDTMLFPSPLLGVPEIRKPSNFEPLPVLPGGSQS